MLDWMALHGINLPLAWSVLFSPFIPFYLPGFPFHSLSVIISFPPSLLFWVESNLFRLGYESMLQQVFLSINLTQSDLATFFSGPAFLSWNRFGNIQGSWGNSSLPQVWIDHEFLLSKQIISRMLDLGMTPVLPAFTGFVPESISRVAPNATVVRGSEWNGFGETYSNVTFLEPFDPLFGELQAKLLRIQREVYGETGDVYTLDQYNENVPFSGDPAYLKNISRDTMGSLRDANPNAVWLMQVRIPFPSSLSTDINSPPSLVTSTSIDFYGFLHLESRADFRDGYSLIRWISGLMNVLKYT